MKYHLLLISRSTGFPQEIFQGIFPRCVEEGLRGAGSTGSEGGRPRQGGELPPPG